VARDGSDFGAATPPDGSAVAFIQSTATSSGSIGQKLALAGGSYQVSLQASQRNCCDTGPRDQELYVLVSGVCVGIFQPTNLTGYAPFTSLTFSVRATSRVAGQLLRFVGGATPGYVGFSTSAANPAPVLGTRYTQSAWIRPSIGTGTGTYYVLGNGTGSTAAPYMAITGDGRLVAGYGNGSVLNTARTTAQVIPTGVWSQVTATYDASFLRIYLNGELKLSQPYGVLPVSTSVNYVGNVGPSGNTFFPGDIDEVSQWSRVLSQAEIRQLRHLTLSGAEEGLVSYLQFNDAGTTTTDFASSAVGTLTQATRLSSTAPVGAGTSNLQPVTGAGSYGFAGTGAAISFTVPGTAPYDVVVSWLEGLPLGTQPTAAGLARTYTPAYWIVDRYSPDPFAATITYTLSPTDISPADATAFAATLRLFKRGSNDDGAFDAPIAAAAANAATGTVSFPVTSFSQMVIGTLGASPLPVELVRFTAVAAGNNAVLRWATASEKNNDHFDVEASADGRTFRRIGQVAGHSSTFQAHEYQLVDLDIARYAASLVYYRLRQVDSNGTASYSPVRTVLCTGTADLALFPNPAHGGATTLTGTAPGAAITVFDVLGREVLTATTDAAGTAVLALPRGLATGVYMVRTGSRALRLMVE
jgi:hypothetical protein